MSMSEPKMNEKHMRVQQAMPSESTPLLQQVPIAVQRQRYPHQILRRWCTIALATVPTVVLAVALLYMLITGNNDLFSERLAATTEFFIDNLGETAPHEYWPESDGLKYKELRKIILDTPSAQKAREWSQYYTAGPHVVGKNLSQAEWTRDLWKKFGVDTSEIVTYDLYLNYPISHSLTLQRDGEVEFKATLEEDVLEEDPSTSLPDRVPTYHAYSANGDVTGSLVFCNYGTYADFEDLEAAGIELKGKIALIKYGGIFRGLKVKRAGELGMIGAILYDDPGEDRGITEENGYDAYPIGPARNPSSVQRGSVQYLSVAPGDPTTPGYPSKPGAPRESVEGKIPSIPSLPISYAEALPFLKALNGHGPNASAFPASWHRGGLGYKGVNYNIGPTPDDVTVHLVNEQEYVTTPAWNVIGVINGTIQDEVIIMGNHRDAWIAGGAVDPNSGSASMNEVIRAFGKALDQGWRPQRTMVFASWDGEEYGLLGSTEWVEEYIPWLSEATVAYINVDVGTRGPRFAASAAPVLNKAIYEVTADIQSPNQTVEGQTIGDLWDGYISTMGSGSDFTAFQDFAGISSINIAFDADADAPVYHYHSNYDSFWWMDNYGDPGFKYHVAIAQVLGLLAVKLLEEPVIAFGAADYADGLKGYLENIKKLAQESQIDTAVTKNLFKSVDKAIAKFKGASVRFDHHATDLAATAQEISYFLDKEVSELEQSSLFSAIRWVNKRYKKLERQFLYAPGLDSRNWFKHVVFAPGLWTGYAGATYPGLVEAFDDNDEHAVRKWIHIIETSVKKATHLLESH